MQESTLLDYVRDQLNEVPKPTPQTINHRLGVLRCLYRFHVGIRYPQDRTTSSAPISCDPRSATAARIA